jgi:hypothetical protein
MINQITDGRLLAAPVTDRIGPTSYRPGTARPSQLHVFGSIGKEDVFHTYRPCGMIYLDGSRVKHWVWYN